MKHVKLICMESTADLYINMLAAAGGLAGARDAAPSKKIPGAASTAQLDDRFVDEAAATSKIAASAADGKPMKAGRLGVQTQSQSSKKPTTSDTIASAEWPAGRQKAGAAKAGAAKASQQDTIFRLDQTATRGTAARASKLGSAAVHEADGAAGCQEAGHR